MNTKIELNINDQCYVQLTSAGIERYFQAQRDAGIVEEKLIPLPLINVAGWCKFTFHELMHTFGRMCFIGSTKLPFENNVILFGEEGTVLGTN